MWACVRLTRFDIALPYSFFGRHWYTPLFITVPLVKSKVPSSFDMSTFSYAFKSRRLPLNFHSYLQQGQSSQ